METDTRISRPNLVALRDLQFRAAVQAVLHDGRTLLEEDRLWILWQAVRNTRLLGLPAAEVGSYRGGSAYFIARAFEQLGGASTPIEVIDTFEGHPEGDPSAFDHRLHVAGHFSDTSFAEVRAYLEPFPNVTVHKGAFAEVAPRLAHDAYSFVHLDVDLYKPTKESLEYFSPRLAIGGAIVLDDYGANKCPGIRKVADELSLDHRGFHYWHPHTEQLVLIKTQLEP